MTTTKTPSTVVTEDDFTPQRATASGVTLTLGEMWAVQLDLVSQKRSDTDEVSFPFACPEHGATVARVNQRYICEDGHLHTQSELLQAREAEDGTLVHATKDEIGDLRTGGLDKGVLELHVHPAAEVAATLRADGLGYRARPGKKAPRKAYAVLRALAARDDIALVGWLRLKDSRRLYRLETWNDQIVLQSLIPVEAMHPVDLIAVPELDEAEVSRLGEVVASTATPFDPETYRFDVAAAIAEFVAERAKNPTAVPVAPAAAAQVEEADVISLLEKSLAGSSLAKKAVKPTTKRAAKKAA